MSRCSMPGRRGAVVAALACALLPAVCGRPLAAEGAVVGAPRVMLNGQALDVTWDGITNAPMTVSAVGSDLLVVKGIGEMGRGEVQDIGTLLVNKYRRLLRIRPEQLVLRKAEKSGGSWYLSYRQSVHGLAVYGSSLGFSIDPDGRVRSLGAILYPDARVAPASRLDREHALKIARTKLRETGESDGKLSAESVAIYPERRAGIVEYHRAYIFNFFARKEPGQGSIVNGRAVFVDGMTGRILKTLPLLKPLGCCIP
ncbi:MAG TPA: hypothetical protein PK416_04380 [Thermodesulfobacteriota bacterium]|nr:hypothetical protein [Thermodesulfobacteriota bacterium]